MILADDDENRIVKMVKYRQVPVTALSTEVLGSKWLQYQTSRAPALQAGNPCGIAAASSPHTCTSTGPSTIEYELVKVDKTSDEIEGVNLMIMEVAVRQKMWLWTVHRIPRKPLNRIVLC